jgi:hypothetical protein
MSGIGYNKYFSRTHSLHLHPRARQLAHARGPHEVPGARGAAVDPRVVPVHVDAVAEEGPRRARIDRGKVPVQHDVQGPAIRKEGVLFFLDKLAFAQVRAARRNGQHVDPVDESVLRPEVGWSCQHVQTDTVRRRQTTAHSLL